MMGYARGMVRYNYKARTWRLSCQKKRGNTGSEMQSTQE